MKDIIKKYSPEFQKTIVNFEEYRSICDQYSTAYRPIGILSDDLYEAALADQNTVFVDGDRGKIPTLVNLEYSEGYDVDRCKRLMETDSPYLLALPVTFLEEKPLFFMGQENVAIIVESDTDSIELDRQTILGSMPAVTEFVAHEFIDPRIEDKGHQFAEMTIYTGRTTCLDEPEDTSSSIKKAFEKIGMELLPDTGLSLLDAEDLRGNPDIHDQLWGLFKDRFEWLGDYHPVSMEDTKSEFDEIVLADKTFIPVRFENGRMVAAGIVMNNIYDCPWIKPKVLELIEKSSSDKETIPFYFFGIAAYKQDEGGEQIKNMQEVVHFHCRLARDTGIDYRIIFESSNMSSLYIPDATTSYINSSGFVRLEEPIHKLASMRYWYIKQAG